MGKIMGRSRLLAVLVAIMLFAPMGQFAAADDLATPGVETPDPMVEGESNETPDAGDGDEGSNSSSVDQPGVADHTDTSVQPPMTQVTPKLPTVVEGSCGESGAPIFASVEPSETDLDGNLTVIHTVEYVPGEVGYTIVASLVDPATSEWSDATFATWVDLGNNTVSHSGTVVVPQCQPSLAVAETSTENLTGTPELAITAEGQPGTITITVLDDETSAPVAGAAVTVYGFREQVATGTTDDGGTFTTDQIPTGDYSVEVSHDEYFAAYEPVQVNDDTQNTIRMAPRVAGTLTITVLDENTGEPVIGAIVDVGGRGVQTASGVTDGDGVFTTAQLPADDYSVVVSHIGYFDSHEYVRISGETNTLVYMTPRVAGALTVTVMDDLPLEDALVVVTSGDAQVAAGTTDTAGEFTTGRLPAGDYSVTVSHAGNSDSYAYVRVNADTSLTVRMYPSAQYVDTLTITTLEIGSDAPIGGVAVVVRDYYTNLRVASGTTDGAGKFTTERLPYGYYSVAISHAEYFYEKQGVVPVSNDHNATTMRMVPQTSGAITILAVDRETNAPLADASITVVRLDTGMEMVSVQETSDGTFTTPQFPAGIYRVSASHWGYISDVQEVRLGGDTSVTLRLDSQLDATLTVNVVDASTDAPIAGANVTVEIDWNLAWYQVGDGVTNSNGIFTMPTRDRKIHYRVQVTHLEYAWAQNTYDIQGDGSVTLTVRLVPPSESTGNLNVLVRDFETSGSVYPRIPNAVVTIREKSTGEVVATGLTNGVGVFDTTAINASPLRAGYYSVSAYHADFATRQWDTFVEGPSSTGVLLKRLEPNGGITVKDGKTDTPIAGATVLVENRANEQVASGITQSDGTFALPLLPDDSFSITISHPDFFTSNVSRSFYRDRSLVVHMVSRVDPDRTYTVTVLDDETGLPIVGADVLVVRRSDHESPSYVRSREIVDTGITSSEGMFTTDPLPDNTFGYYYAVGIASPGYETVSTFNLPGDISSVVVRMSRNDGSISITVLDDRTGEPISGANVVLMRGDSTDVISGTSGSDGIFAVAPIAAGRYIVEISHGGYAEQASPSYYYPRPGEDVAGTVRLHPLGGELTVTALNDTTDAPIAGANIVVVSNWGNGEQVATGITGSDGTFSTAWLPIGGYSVLVSHANYVQGDAFIWVTGEVRSPVYLAQTDPGAINALVAALIAALVAILSSLGY